MALVRTHVASSQIVSLSFLYRQICLPQKIERVEKGFWSAKACQNEAEIPLCGAFAIFSDLNALEPQLFDF
jgi:hypothetical protein